MLDCSIARTLSSRVGHPPSRPTIKALISPERRGFTARMVKGVASRRLLAVNLGGDSPLSCLARAAIPPTPQPMPRPPPASAAAPPSLSAAGSGRARRLLTGSLNVFRAVRDVGALLQFFKENTGCRDGFWLGCAYGCLARRDRFSRPPIFNEIKLPTAITKVARFARRLARIASALYRHGHLSW